MASASSSSAKNLFHDSKRRLADRVTGTVNNVASVGRQIVRGSRSNDVCINYSIKLNISSKILQCFFVLDRFYSTVDFNACGQAVRTTGDHHGEYLSKS